MTPHDLATTFYDAFSRCDGDTMASLYAPTATFEDPAFGQLTGVEAGAMWRMLTGQAKDLKVTYTILSSDDETVRVNWIATYTFSQTGRKVVNDIQATIRCLDGQIVDHRDVFDFHTWSRQALGTPGLLLGWTGFLKNKVRAQARKGLDRFMAG